MELSEFVGLLRIDAEAQRVVQVDQGSVERAVVSRAQCDPIRDVIGAPGSAYREDVSCVNVRDSNAGGGETIYAFKSQGKLPVYNNINWVFTVPPGTILLIR